MARTQIRFLETSHIEACEQDLVRLLAESVEGSAIPRVFLGFAQRDGTLLTKPTLRTADSEVWPIGMAYWTEGQIGETFERGKVTNWPEDGMPYLNVSKNTIRSICYPVRVEREVAAVLLFDFFEGDEEDEALFHLAAAELTEKVSSALTIASTVVEKKIEQIETLTERCRQITRSKRGYTAILRRGQLPIVVSVGRQKDDFIELGFDEGLSGEAIRTGKAVIMDNVWESRKYLSSDKTINSEAVIPLHSEGQMVGILNLEAQQKRHFTSQMISNIESFVKQISNICYELIKHIDLPDSGYSQSLGYVMSDCLATGMIERTEDYRVVRAQMLESLSNSIQSIKRDKWKVQIYEPNELSSRCIEAPEKRNYTEVQMEGSFTTRIFIYSSGNVFCCVEVTANEFLEDIDRGRIDFLGRHVSSEFRRRQDEGAHLSYQSMIEACLFGDFSFGEICNAYLSELCLLLRADVAAAYLSQENRQLGQQFVPICEYSYLDGPHKKKNEIVYTANEALRFFEIHAVNGRVDLTMLNKSNSRPEVTLEEINKGSVAYPECNNQDVKAYIAIPFFIGEQIEGFLRFTRTNSRGDQFYAGSFDWAERLNKIFSLITRK